MTTCKACHYREGSPDGEAIGTCYGPPPTPAWTENGRINLRPQVQPSTRACSLYRPNEKLIGHDGRKGEA